MRSTFSVSTWTWTLAGCLAFFLGCRPGEGDRCEIESDCGSGLTCSKNGQHNGICIRKETTSTGTSTSTSTSSSDTSTATSTDTSTGTTDASVTPSGGEPDAAAQVVDGALAD